MIQECKKCRKSVAEVPRKRCYCPDPEDNKYCAFFTPMTNGDRIRAMTDEELVGVIACPAETEGYKGIHPCLRPGPYKDCENCIKEWLQQPVKEDAE